MERLIEIVPVEVEQIPDTLKMGLLYISYRYGIAVHLCPCGCGGKVVCDLKPHWENGWDIIDKEGLVTLRPSIGNWSGEHPYHAHYYITDNKIEWL